MPNGFNDTTKQLLTLSGLLLGLGFYLFLGSLAEVNPLQTAIAGEAPPTWGVFFAHRKAIVAVALLVGGGGGLVLSAFVIMTGTASGMMEGGYQRRLRRRARRALPVDNPSPLLVALKMLEFEREERGWQLETLLVYLNAAKADEAPVDQALLTDLKAFCKQAHAAADAVLAERGAGSFVRVSGREWRAADLVTEVERVVSRIHDLRHRH